MRFNPTPPNSSVGVVPFRRLHSPPKERNVIAFRSARNGYLDC
jgi:hypothetical protein